MSGYFGRQTSTADTMLEGLSQFDERGTWEVLHSAGNIDEDSFRVAVVSKGAVPVIEPGVFGDIRDSVVAEQLGREGEEPRCVQMVSFIGDLAGFMMFSGILGDRLHGGAEGDIDVIGELGGPLFTLDLFLGAGPGGDPYEVFYRGHAEAEGK